MDFQIDKIITLTLDLPGLGVVNVPATVTNTWIVMLVLMVVSWLATRKINSDLKMSKWQNLMEVLVRGMRDQIKEFSGHEPGKFTPFIGTLFLFIFVSNLMGLIPGFVSPTASLSTTSSFGLCVFFAVPFFGIGSLGVKKYFKLYFEPTPIMFPLNVISELSRTLSISVRLFGNVLSGTVIGLILLALVPFFVPVVMMLLGIFTGTIQAYIFPALAMVYIASALEATPAEEIKKSGFGEEILPEQSFAA